MMRCRKLRNNEDDFLDMRFNAGNILTEYHCFQYEYGNRIYDMII